MVKLAGAVALLFVAQPALAQYVAPLRYNEGPGIKLGEGMVFHPGIALEGRYDSNPLYVENSPPQAGYLHLIGHLDLATLPPQRRTDGQGRVAPQKVDFRLKTALGYREYLSSNDRVTSQRALDVDAGFLLALFPQGVFSFELVDDFARTVSARYTLLPNIDNPTLGRDTNRATARFKLTPGGGRISFALAYSLAFDIFEDPQLAGANKIWHEIALNAKWKLLPKTALTLDVIEQIYTYYDRTGGVFGTLGEWQNVGSYPLRIYLGLVGLITARLSTVLKLGYGNGFYSDSASYNMMVAMFELGYQFSPFAKVRVGFEHGFQDSFIGNYFTDENAYVGYDHLIAQRFLLHLRVDYRYRQYEGLPPGVTALRQNLVTASLGLDYQIRDWVYVGLGYDFDVQDRTSGPTAQQLYAPDFLKHQVYGKVGFSY
jgi:hypothetical protein